MKKSSLLSLTLLIVPLVTAAQDTSSAYIEFDTGFSYIEIPKTQFFAIRSEAAPFARGQDLDLDDDSSTAVFFGGRFGFDLPVTLFETDDVGIEIRASRQRHEINESVAFFDREPGIRFGWVTLDNDDGAFGTPNLATLIATSSRTVEYYTVEGLLKLGYATNSGHPYYIFVGPSHRKLGTASTISGTIITSVTTTEWLDTSYNGATIGLATQFKAPFQFVASIDTALSLYQADTDYQGSYSDTAGYNFNRNLGQTEFAYGLGTKLTLKRDISEALTISLFGGIDYLSYAPQVEYGSIPGDPAGGILSLTNGDLFSANGGVEFEIKF